MATAKTSPLPKSTIRKRSINIDGHKTSVTVEDSFWEALGEIARQRGVSVASLIEKIAREPLSTNLSSGIRLFVLCEARNGCLNVRRTIAAPNLRVV